MAPLRDVVLQVCGMSLDGFIAEAGTQFDDPALQLVDPARDRWMADSIAEAAVHIMGRTGSPRGSSPDRCRLPPGVRTPGSCAATSLPGSPLVFSFEVGSGAGLFAGVGTPRRLELTDVGRFPSGCAALVYRRPS